MLIRHYTVPIIIYQMVKSYLQVRIPVLFFFFFCFVFAGNTEQAFLSNSEYIVEYSLPDQKVMNLFPDKESAE